MKSSSPVSAHWRSSKTRTVVPLSAMRSKKMRQAANSSSRPPAGASSTPSSASSAGSIQRRSLASGTYSASVAATAARVVRLVVVLGQAERRADHLAQRPERDALAVGRRAAAVPVDVLDDAVDVLLELPGQPALADAARPGDRHQPRPPLAAVAWSSVLEQAQLLVAPDERRLEGVRAALARHARRRRARARQAGTGASCP